MMQRIQFTSAALVNMTEAQSEAILHLANEQVELLEISFGAMEVRTGWLSFRQKYNSETRSIYGDIAPDGGIRTYDDDSRRNH